MTINFKSVEKRYHEFYFWIPSICSYTTLKKKAEKYFGINKEIIKWLRLNK